MKCRDDAMETWLVLVSLLRLLLIGHFRVPKTLTFKTTLSAKPFLRKWDYLHENRKLFSYQELRRQPCFETEIWSNWQKAYCARPIPCLEFLCRYIKNETQCFITRWNTEKRVENTTRSGVFLTNFEMFHLVMKHCVSCLILLLKQNDFRRRN